MAHRACAAQGRIRGAAAMMDSEGLAAAIRDANDRLASDPAAAERRAREILRTNPRATAAAVVLARARGRQGDAPGARAILEPLARERRRDAALQHELGELLVALGDRDGAIAALRNAVAARPDLGPAWRTLGDQLFLAGEPEQADRAYGRYCRAPIAEPALARAAADLEMGRLAEAEAVLRERLGTRPTDVLALAMLGEVYRRQARFVEAERCFTRCIERHPGHDGVVFALALVLRAQTREAEAVERLEALAARDPDNVGVRGLLASCLSTLGDQARAAAIFKALLARSDRDPGLWVSHGLLLKGVGKIDEAVGAFRRAIGLAPGHGEAWYRLAELKTRPFDAAEEAALRDAMSTSHADTLTAVQIRYALARAREDHDDYKEAFDLYTEGARLNRSRLPYDPDGASRRRRDAERTFTRAFFAERASGGSPDPAPIFIVGLPRSGSTLVEQILASHPAVEGTSELPYLPRIGRSLGGALARLSADERRRLGEHYLARAARHRRLARPFFIDKNPGNFQHIALIHLLLPNARVIDVRRDPMANGVALYRHLLGDGWSFACDLGDIGRFYRDYVLLMAHFDAVLPGRIHRVIYEDLVHDTEKQIRRLLARLGLPYEDACLKFHETERAVLTPSAAQVRRPVFRDGLDHWRRFEPWLGPLEAGLGPALADWR